MPKTPLKQKLEGDKQSARQADPGPFRYLLRVAFGLLKNGGLANPIFHKPYREATAKGTILVPCEARKRVPFFPQSLI